MHNFDFYQIISFFCILNFLVISCIMLFIKSGNKKANRLLCCFIVTMSLVTYILTIRSSYELYPVLIRFKEPLMLLIIPVLYFFTKQLLSKENVIKRNNLWHFIPSILALVVAVKFAFEPFADKMYWYNSNAVKLHYHFLYSGVFLQIICYSTYILRFIRTHKEAIQKDKKLTKTVNRIKQIFITIVVSISIGIIIYDFFFSFKYIYLLSLSLLPLYYSFLILIIKSPNFFESLKIIEEYYQKMNDLQMINTLNNKLDVINNYLVESKVYVKPELSITDISKMTNIQTHLVSKTINEVLGINFSEYINNFRIDEAKRMILSNQNQLSLEGIGNSVGFKSKTSFYNSFKRNTGLTPGEYKKDCLKHEEVIIEAN